MTSHVVVAAAVMILTWHVLVEGLHAGSGIAAALPGGSARKPSWQVLGPLVLIDEVWLVLLVSWVQTALPEVEHRLWDSPHWPFTLAALGLSIGQFAALLLAPVSVRRARAGAAREFRARRLAMAGLGVAVVVAWSLVLAGLARVSGAPAVLATTTAIFAATALGLAAHRWNGLALGTIGRAGAARTYGDRRTMLLLLAGAAGVSALAWTALAVTDPTLRALDGISMTSGLLAASAIVTCLPLLVLQGMAWRWTLRHPAATDWPAQILPAVRGHD